MFIGILGGAFNPIHNGHLHIAHYVLKMLQMDRIIFVPTGDPPHKPATSLAPAHHRLEMVKRAIEPYAQFTVSDREIRSAAISYSVDTITHIKTEFPEGTKLGFIIGLDAFLEFSSWRNVDRLLTLCHFVVCSRPGFSFSQLHSLPFIPDSPPTAFESLDKQYSTRFDIPLSSGKSIILLSVSPCDVSASTIREYLVTGRPVTPWLPPPVESYIICHRLYQ